MSRWHFTPPKGLLLIALALILWAATWRESGYAANLFQSPLPPNTNPCVTLTQGDFVVKLFGYVTALDGTTTITFAVQNNGKKDVSHLAFSTLAWPRLQPSNGITYTAGLGNYAIAWTNSNGHPGFPSVKYTPLFSGYSKGKSDTFALQVSSFDPNAALTVQIKAGTTVATVTFNLANPTCNKTPPPFSPLPTPTPTPEGGVVLPSEPQVAQCVFTPPPGGMPPDELVIPLSAYSFSAPQLVVTNTAPIGIQQWLPDNQTLLITRHTGRGNKLEVVNTQTKAITELLAPNRAIRSARWLPTEQSVVWRELGSPGNEAGYWARSFAPAGERRLSDNSTGAGAIFDTSPSGKEAVFLSLPGGTQPLIWHQENKNLRALPVDLSNLRYEKGLLYPFQPFNVNWHPNGNQLLFWDGTWTFLYDLPTHRVCEINLFTLSPRFPSVQEASWSPNGRYLLLKVAIDPLYTSLLGPYDRVLVLDTYTGSAIQYALDHPIANFSWAPDNQTVAMRGGTEGKIEGFSSDGFYLFNIRNGAYQRILPEQETLSGMGEMLAWSPDGRTLAIQCMDTLRDAGGGLFDRICISQITINQ